MREENQVFFFSSKLCFPLLFFLSTFCFLLPCPTNKRKEHCDSCYYIILYIYIYIYNIYIYISLFYFCFLPYTGSAPQKRCFAHRRFVVVVLFVCLFSRFFFFLSTKVRKDWVSATELKEKERKRERREKKRERVATFFFFFVCVCVFPKRNLRAHFLTNCERTKETLSLVTRFAIIL